ncbi:hypothetical protein GETHLI_22390 [Geothrix limicola]|uniref:histidine kinase n=1 Tax=Geothrix limicola TaxID=2927978 RepID=A0ABQ5QGF3_9BACT|nr:response regulator [Geothrix limicola]GLH73737.1 hypothetical protein GETHLI_22390 [Geothrix limicola]
MSHLTHTSLRHKLILVIMLTAGMALLAAGISFVAIARSEFRASVQRELQLLAEVIGEGSAAALEFKEPAEANRLLANLRVNTDIVEAAILDRNGQPFGTYRREGSGPVSLPTDLHGRTFQFESGRIWLAAPIVHSGERLGTIYLRADTKALTTRLLWVAGTTLLATLLIASAAMGLAFKMGKLVSEPILHLTEAAHRMAKSKDPGLRVARESEDEVGSLVDAFNDMLDRLGERQARLEEAQHLARLGNWAIQPGLQHTEWSEETFRIFGLEPGVHPIPDQEAFRALIHPEDLVPLEAAFLRCWKEAGRFEIDHRILRPDGSLGWVHTSGICLRDGEGQLMMRGTVMDITERKHAEAAMLQGQKLESLGVLTGGIAHDFNNLLGALQGYLDMARMDLPEGSSAESYLGKAERVIQRASELIRQMLAYSGRGQFQVKPLDLGQLVKEMGHLLSISIPKKAELVVQTADPLPAVVADAAQIQQVIMNLVINAGDALKEQGGYIKVRTYAESLDEESLAATYAGQAMVPGPFVVLEVEDNGHGMDGDTLARIFDPFFTTKFKGRGLGLAALLGIVKGHNGGIKVYSEVGQGTTFKVLLPASQEVVAAAEEKVQEDAYRGSGTVLLIDDEASILSATGDFLKRMGFEVRTASNGLEGVSQVLEHPGECRLVLLDLTMPQMDGVECFQRIRELEPGLPVIMTSGFSAGEGIEGLWDQGLSGFLQKPYSLATLRAKVRETLG